MGISSNIGIIYSYILIIEYYPIVSNIIQYYPYQTNITI